MTTDNQPALQPPERLTQIKNRYSGSANEGGNYEVRANDLAWLIQEVELSRARVVDGVAATEDLDRARADGYNDGFRQGQQARGTAFAAYNQAIGDAQAAIRDASQGGGYWAATFINAIARKCSPHVYVNRLAATAPIAATQDEQGETFDYACATNPNCGWVSTARSRPLSRGLSVGCPRCKGDARFTGSGPSSQSPAIKAAGDPQDELVDEVQHRMDQVVEAAVEWHQAGREGGEWIEAADRLGSAIDSLLELRQK